MNQSHKNGCKTLLIQAPTYNIYFNHQMSFAWIQNTSMDNYLYI